MRILFTVLRAGIALAILAAIVGQMIVSLAFWEQRGVQDITTNVVNFYSFFTIDANVFSMVLMAIGAVLLLRRTPDPRWFHVARASVVTYMVTTGVVYNLLLRGIELPQGNTLGWSNEVLHVVAPLYLLIDWLFAPGRKPLSYRVVWIVIVFPIIWAGYTLIRGPFTPDEVYGNEHWYPYPFLNPDRAATGYLSVSFYILLISAIISLAGLGVVWVSRRKSVQGDAPAR
ncbi:Pr6Pr family membrane protein [Microbacteriaceae bacterium VKM Ac-2854]|nr:Pr6Pr family membrane protein [Microbacteriaceae bacterium VKM Ac-2854]